MKKCVTAIVGSKWGDEGKGKVASYEAQDAVYVCKGNGGANAGHSVIINGENTPLHHIPGGIAYPGTTALIGPGTVIDLPVLLQEIALLQDRGVFDILERLKISGNAHVVLPSHKKMDSLCEEFRTNPIGTTKRGIGPCYADKHYRVGVRMYDLLLDSTTLKKKIKEATQIHRILFAQSNMVHDYIPSVLAYNSAAKNLSQIGALLSNCITDIEPIIANAIERGDKIVIEGAQAYRLDIDHGDYPMVTSSNTVTAGLLSGMGIPPQALKEAIGIDKAYNSRVGNGIFPTECCSNEGNIIRNLGHEFGTTTGRPRRCGWMDVVPLRSAKYTCGLDCLCINHLDTLGKISLELGSVKVCTAYKYKGHVIDYFPQNLDCTSSIVPVYTEIVGKWALDEHCTSFEDLPELAQSFIELVEETSGLPVKYIGTGPSNDDLIVRNL